MCGIAGLIHRGKSSNVGSELQGMLQALKHRGEDSTVTLYMEILMVKISLCVLKWVKT
jgi:Asparagine synthase (glutamine-hydrolyzing)